MTFDAYVCWNWDGQFTKENVLISITNFDATPDESCLSLFECWNELSELELIEAYEHLAYEASLISEIAFTQYWIGVEDSPPTSIDYSFIRQNCYKLCLIMLPDPPYQLKDKFQCGDQCCLRGRRMTEIDYTQIILDDRPCNDCPYQILRFDISEPEFTIIGDACDQNYTLPLHCALENTNYMCQQECGPK